ncbi:MAG: tryptophan--tRNA ligase [Burkholderiaceae bacterium]|nr:tryptophan--tRNA ligase [Burkholderiaceae bacterium]
MHPSPTVRVLTGITTTGTPHLGNYAGAIAPTVRASQGPGIESFMFLADYHALIKCGDPARVQSSTLQIAASWLAAGLEPRRVTFYRQSDIPEIPQLCWLLTCVTGKGLLNRAHAYKAALDKNAAAALEPDDGVTAGLFMYPVLMAADILMFRAHRVPVGRDQVQHIEMARDMAASFNHLYGQGQELLTLPSAQIDADMALLPGLDGRKMSKSYDNVIALFGSREQLRKQIMGIVTDSRAPGEPKDTEGSTLFAIYKAFATPEESAAYARAFAEGIAWGEAKERLFERLDQEIAPKRAHYAHLMDNPREVEQTLLAGAEKARALAAPYLRELRHAVGLRPLASAPPASAAARAPAQTAAAAGGKPAFKQYREKDGRFYFKLLAAQPAGKVLLQSRGFDSPQEAGKAVKLLQTVGIQALAQLTKDCIIAADMAEKTELEHALRQLMDDPV